MKRKIFFCLAFIVFVSSTIYAKTDIHNVTGVIVDKWGSPVSGAFVKVYDGSTTKVFSDKDGKFNITANNGDNLLIGAPDQEQKIVKIHDSSKPITVTLGFSSEPINVGFGIVQPLEESTMSVSTTSNREFNNRSAKNIGNSLYGTSLGLTTLENSGDFDNTNPTFYIRGLQSLSGSSPLILVDGIERNINYITPEEVECVTILKDAPAVALYGYKGINGAVNIITKRGKYQSKEINFSYDHAINWEERRPNFVDAYTYANAINEALGNDGKGVRYSANELNAFKNGTYPYLYPNINWIKETFKDTGASNLYNLSFRGGGTLMRYYNLLNLQLNDGFIAHPNMNDGYSTQNKFSKANFRTNLDIDLTSSTSLVVNLDGVLLEVSRPGLTSDNLWDKIYTTPAAAFPVKTQDGIWGGNATWSGYYNPVALTEGRAYTKAHTRALFSDITLNQNLSSVLNGLGATFRVAYDNIASYWENHSRSYQYASDAVSQWDGDKVVSTSRYIAGSNGSMGTDSKLDWQNKNLNFVGGLTYNNTFGNNSISSLLMWNYEYRNSNGQNNTWYRQNVSLYTHYGYLGKYFVDFSLTSSGSNKLAPGHKWAFSPTVSAAWLISKEAFLRDLHFIDFLKLRASWGIINTDNIPKEDYWEQSFGGGNGYSLGGNYDWDNGWAEGQLASVNSTHERGYKYNVGFDATLFKNLDITFDQYYQRRSDIWVSASGENSSILGISNPYVNAGTVDSWGCELGVDYIKNITPAFQINIGGKLSVSKNKIINELEEPKAYDYLKATGQPVGQIFGFQAIGFFKDQSDINNSPTQQFSEVKPGDIKYKDQNGDGVINSDDEIALGYNAQCPEIYFSFNLGAEWKGLGFNALFQGTRNYTAVLNTKSLYWPLINNTNISTYYYKNRWTPENQDVKYPRLTAESNDNNFQTNSVWLADRSFLKLRQIELYYKFKNSFLNKLKFVSGAKLYVRGIDLLCFDHIKIADPESYGATYPLTRSVVMGLAIGF